MVRGYFEKQNAKTPARSSFKSKKKTRPASYSAKMLSDGKGECGRISVQLVAPDFIESPQPSSLSLIK